MENDHEESGLAFNKPITRHRRKQHFPIHPGKTEMNYAISVLTRKYHPRRRTKPKPQQWTKTTGSKINKTKKCCLAAYKGSFNIYQVAWDDEEVLCSREACRKNLWEFDGLMVTEKGPKKLLIWCETVQRGWGRTPFVWVKLYQSNPPI